MTLTEMAFAGHCGLDIQLDRIGGELLPALSRLSQQQGTTLFMTLLASYNAFLRRCTGRGIRRWRRHSTRTEVSPPSRAALKRGASGVKQRPLNGGLILYAPP